MHLDHRNGVPLYLQIEERVRLGIAQGVWQLGELLPPEVELCRILRVSRGPVRQALGRLVQEGLLVRHRGRGTRVVREIPIHGLILVSPYRAIQVAGMTPVVRVLVKDLRHLPRHVAARWKDSGLSGTRRSQAVFLERVFTGSGEPIAHAQSWLPADRFGKLLQYEVAQRPLLDIVAKEFGVIITRLEETMELTTMPPRIAQLLHVRPASPCLAVTLCQWSSGQPVEYAEFSLSPAKSRFLITGLLALENMTRQEDLEGNNSSLATTGEIPHGMPAGSSSR